MMFVRVNSLQTFWKRHIEAAPIMPKRMEGFVDSGNGNPKLKKFVEKSEKLADAMAGKVIKEVAGNKDLSDRYGMGYSLNFNVEVLGKAAWGETCDVGGHVHELCPMGNLEAWHEYKSSTSGNLRVEYSVRSDFFGKNMPLDLGSIKIDLPGNKVFVVYPTDKRTVEYPLLDFDVSCLVFYRAVREFKPENAKARA